MNSMRTYPIINEKKSSRPYAFEVENAYVSAATMVRLLREVEGVTHVRRRKMFSKSREILVEFKYMNDNYVVWEPFGDSSRYWIGPKNPEESMGNIINIENIFKRHRPPFWRGIVGDFLSFRLFKRLIGGRHKP